MPFDPQHDYQEYVDGKPRLDGVRDFLAARQITLLEGTRSDPPTLETVNASGSRKNAIVLRRIHAGGWRVF